MAIHFLEAAHLHAGLTVTEAAVLACFGNSANDHNRVGFPGYESLAAWSKLGRSGLYKVIGQLVEKGLLEKVSSGYKGHRAEYAVFPRGGCCPMHGPLPGRTPLSAGHDSVGSAGVDPIEDTPDPVDNPPKGLPKGPPKGPPMSGPLPGYPTTTTNSGEVPHVSKAQDREPPSPAPSSTGTAPPAGDDDPEPPVRCPNPHPPETPCRGCGDAKRAHRAWEDRAVTRRRSRDEAERRLAAEARRLVEAEVRACRLCDEHGLVSSEAGGMVRCTHDPSTTTGRGRAVWLAAKEAERTRYAKRHHVA